MGRHPIVPSGLWVTDRRPRITLLLNVIAGSFYLCVELANTNPDRKSYPITLAFIGVYGAWRIRSTILDYFLAFANEHISFGLSGFDILTALCISQVPSHQYQLRKGHALSFLTEDLE